MQTSPACPEADANAAATSARGVWEAGSPRHERVVLGEDKKARVEGSAVRVGRGGQKSDKKKAS